ncbi:MAG TPA: hypothetical protein VGE97_02485 [Nitrososphaera sp.]|jgi:hypothetical protein
MRILGFLFIGLAVLFIAGISNWTNYSNGQLPHLQLTEADKNEMCAKQVKQMLQIEEPTQWMIDQCKIGINYANTNPILGSGASLSEIKEYCTNFLRDYLKDEPAPIVVNMCVGTLATQLNK